MKKQNTHHDHLKGKQGTTRAGGHKHRLATLAISAATAVTLGLGVMGCGALPSFGGPGGQRTAATWESATGTQVASEKQAASGNPAIADKLEQAAVKTADDGTAQSATVLVYLNGSDLESEAGEATTDIAEMLKSGIGQKANVVIETLGTRRWQDFGIASDHAQRHVVKNGKLELVDDSLGQLDTTDPSTLSDFIRWGVENYPADRYMLILWDHGAGPVYGFGVDEFQKEEYAALTLDEMKRALDENPGVHFDMIGMDCCIMSSVETCYALAPYCDYTVLSEDFEPGVGWSYARWMSMLEDNPSVSMAELGKVIVDDMVSATAADPANGDATLALIDESAVPALYEAWIEFAYANEDALLKNNYSQEIEWRGRPSMSQVQQQGPGAGSVAGQGEGGHGPGGQGLEATGGYGWGGEGGADTTAPDGYDPDYQGFDDVDAYQQFEEWFGQDGWGSFPEDLGDLSGLWDYWDSDMSYVTMTDYYVTDIREVASTVDSSEATALKAAMDQAIVHFGKTSGEEGMGGIGVTLPYGDPEFYDQLVQVFTAAGFDKDYIDWLGAFVNAEGVDNRYDFGYGDPAGYGFGGADGFGYGYGSDGYGYGDEADQDTGYGYGTDGFGYEDWSRLFGELMDPDGFGSGYGYGDAYGYGPSDAYGYGPGEAYGYGAGDAYGYGPSDSYGTDSSAQGHGLEGQGGGYSQGFGEMEAYVA